jgi:cell division septum initiation protein DivIVA
MSDIIKGRPEFTTSIRGYDRFQVDDYIERLRDLVAEAEQRARVAESELEFRDAESELELNRHASVGPRVSEILDLAVAESKELRERIKQKSDKLFARARRQAEDIVESAQAEALQMREQAERECKDLLATRDTEREHAHAEIVELQRRQALLLGNLRQLQDELGAAVDLIPDQPEAPTGVTRVIPIPHQVNDDASSPEPPGLGAQGQRPPRPLAMRPEVAALPTRDIPSQAWR